MISCYDQRPTSEIRDCLLGASAENIDLVELCILLCDRVAALEAKKQAVEADADCGACEQYRLNEADYCPFCLKKFNRTT